MKNNACMYLRLSRDDGELAESNSISSQRELITSYANNNNINLVGEYVDDGISGATFDRPSFKQMIVDLEKKEFNAIIVKDLSRFGRDYIETGKYLQRIFPEKNIRFISINDNYDSKSADTNDTHLILPIRNFINDSYCRDISMKVKSSQMVKRKKGEFIGAFAPFGYKKSPLNKHQLVIDRDVTHIIEIIFDMKIEGYSSNAIANHLNKLSLPTPNKHKENNGESVGFSAKSNKYSSKIVNRIIENRVYIGNLEQGKNTKLNYKSSKRIKVLKDDWITTKNAHEPIIPKSKFLAANEMLKRDLYSRNKPSLFSGMLFCKDCGSSLIKRTLSYKNKKTHYFICSNYNKSGDCTRHSIKEDDLKTLVQSLLLNYISYNKTLYEKCINLDISNMKFEAQSLDLENDKKKYTVLRKSLFLDLEDGLIDESEFEKYRKTYARKISEIEKSIEKRNSIARELKENIENKTWLIDLKASKDVNISRFNLVTLVNKIYVSEEKEIIIDFYKSEQLEIIKKIINTNSAINSDFNNVINIPFRLPKDMMEVHYG